MSNINISARKFDCSDSLNPFFIQTNISTPYIVGFNYQLNYN